MRNIFCTISNANANSTSYSFFFSFFIFSFGKVRKSIHYNKPGTRIPCYIISPLIRHRVNYIFGFLLNGNYCSTHVNNLLYYVNPGINYSFLNKSFIAPLTDFNIQQALIEYVISIMFKSYIYFNCNLWVTILNFIKYVVDLPNY